MSINKINQSLPLTRKFELLNDMIVELYGMISKSSYNINEIDSLYSLDIFNGNRLHNRNISLGHTSASYGSWTHVHAETGYSIWKYPITNYVHESTNEVYLDNEILSNRGVASSEIANAFSSVNIYDGSSYTNVTSEASSEEGTAFATLEDTSSYIYCGSANTFTGFKIEFSSRGSNVTPVVEYYNGAWTALEVSDNTNSFKSNGYITWEMPEDWSTVSVNGTNAYFIRISTTTVPSIAPSIYYLIPYNSVIALLSLSTSQIQNQEWAWCYYNGYIYITLRNTGNTNYLGDYYITSSAGATYKENYFVYNHEILANYRNTTTITPEYEYTAATTYKESIVATSTNQTVFTTTHSVNKIITLFLNGIIQIENVDYTISGTTITLTTGTRKGAKLYVVYFY